MSDTCKCGHDRRSHDLWGSGPCCDCDCDGFEPKGASRLAEFLRQMTPAQRAFYDSPIKRCARTRRA